jgi:hypothetical protein
LNWLVVKLFRTGEWRQDISHDEAREFSGYSLPFTTAVRANGVYAV